MSKDKDIEYRKRRDSITKSQILKPDTANMKALNMIKDVDPKYAKHMFIKNRLVEQFMLHEGGGLELLGQPICPHCEIPCLWDIGGKGYCMSCNNSIPANKITTVAEYLLSELKGADADILNEYLKGAEKSESY